ncbi:MAG: hypothetical protein ACTTG8_06990 [Catonella sp.]|uniref:hypothetical protein n=1 Tax=Catonella sp. TaxID=2382125 RepID=UPI003FA13917
MKKEICRGFKIVKCLSMFLLCVGIVPLAMGCKSGKNTVATNITSVVEKNMDKGYSFKIKDTEFFIGEDPTEKVNRLESDADSFTVPSCAMQGEDKIYTYSGFTLTAHGDSENGAFKLASILLTDDSVQTKEGLYIGQTRKDAENLYGKKKKKENEYIYKKGRMELSIIFEDDKIVSIEYRG